jgi:hypothetical protein
VATALLLPDAWPDGRRSSSTSDRSQPTTPTAHAAECGPVMTRPHRRLDAVRELRELACELAARVVLARRRGAPTVLLELGDAETLAGAILESGEDAPREQ